MKYKFLVAALVLSFISTALPQGMTDKGSTSISGYVAFYTASYDKHKSLFFSVSPSVSYFFANNFELGLSVLYRYSETVYDIPYTTDNYARTYGIGPNAAYYFGKADSKPFVFASYFYGDSITPYSDDNSSSAFAFGAGYLIPINKKVAVTPLLQYEIDSYGNDYIPDQKTFSVGAQFKMFL